MGETDSTEPTVMLPQNQTTCVVELPPYRRRFYFENASAQFRSSPASNGTSTTFLPTLSCKSKGPLWKDSGPTVFSSAGVPRLSAT